MSDGKMDPNERKVFSEWISDYKNYYSFPGSSAFTQSLSEFILPDKGHDSFI